MTFQTKNAEFTPSAEIIAFPPAHAADPEANKLRRSRTLIRAAKWRAGRFVRARDLPRLASGLSSLKAGSNSLRVRLAEIEADCHQALRSGAAHYDPSRHVLALAALLIERREAAGASGLARRG